MSFADRFYGAFDDRQRQMQIERDQMDERRRNAFGDQQAREDQRWQMEARGRERSAWGQEDAKRAAVQAAAGDPAKMASAFGQFGDVQGMAQAGALQDRTDERAKASKADAAEQLKRAARMAIATPDPQARERIIQNAEQYAVGAGYSRDIISAEIGQLRAYLASEGEQPEYKLMEDGTQLMMGPNGWQVAGKVELPQPSEFQWQGDAGGTPYRVDPRTGQVIRGQGTIPMRPMERAAMVPRNQASQGGGYSNVPAGWEVVQ